MKLYVKNTDGKKIYLDEIAPTRMALARKLKFEFFRLEGEVYHVKDVYAEKTTSAALTGAVVGGLTGALLGPIGILIGGGLGTLLGGGKDINEDERVELFNSSRFDGKTKLPKS